MDDSELLRRYADEKSDDAFRELVRRHLSVVYAAALRQVHGDAHLAQDVAQRVFITLAQKARSLRGQRALVGWLYTAARYEGARVVRSEMRRRRREAGAAAMETFDSTALPEEQLRTVLDEAMTQLGGSEREAVLLRFFSGHSFAEIGGVLQISEEAARKRVDRALDKLRENLGRRGMVSTASALATALNAYAAPAVSPTLMAAVTAGVCQQLATTTAVPLALFMSSTKALALAAGVLVLAGALVWHDRNTLAQAETRRATATAELASANDREAKLAAELALVRHDVAEAEKPATPPRRNGARVAATRVAATGPAAAAYLSDPKFRELTRTSAKARVHLEFQRLYRQLGLTSEQIARFEDIMAQQDQARYDAAIVRANGGDEQTVYQRSGPEWSQAMRELLGNHGFTQLQDYLKTTAVRAFVDNFAVQATAIGTPVSPELSDRIAALALANDATYQQGKGTNPGNVNWNAVWDPAAKLLNPDQLALLQRTVEVWSLQKQVSLRFKPTANAQP
jgi:RNA polymerase sigma factor (sigma-70 family)